MTGVIMIILSCLQETKEKPVMEMAILEDYGGNRKEER